jgi:ribosomal protein L29
MAKPIDKLAAEIRNLPDKEKLQLVDAILEELVKSRTRRSTAFGQRKPGSVGRHIKPAEFPWSRMVPSWPNIDDREGRRIKSPFNSLVQRLFRRLPH